MHNSGKKVIHFHSFLFTLKGNAQEYQIWPKNCSSFKSEPQFRFNNFTGTDQGLASCKIMMIDQFAILEFQLGPDSNDEQF